MKSPASSAKARWVASSTLVEQNKSVSEFWERYCAFDARALAFPDHISEAMRALGQVALALLDRKARAPLEQIEPDKSFADATASYEAAEVQAQEIAAAIPRRESQIAKKREETGAVDAEAAEAELAHLNAIKVRHSDPIAGLCAEHASLTATKTEIDERKTMVRRQLDEHSGSVMQPYERRINHYLDAFNAGFSIAETRHGYPAGTAASFYQLVINETAIDIGDGRTPSDRPSFKNTLSAGDRTTLALAFYLAHLEQDQGLARKTVVFDDPFSSQDAFRRRQTVHEIAKIARNCAQVIVLSHETTFLKQVSGQAPAAERVALTIADHRAHGSKIMPIDLERACLGRTATDIDDLLTYVATGAGNLLDLIRKMRVVVETHWWTSLAHPGIIREWPRLAGRDCSEDSRGGRSAPCA